MYYANHLDKVTQWTHPRTGKRKKVSCSLPFGWERRRLPDGKILYVNHDEEKTSYIDPRLAFAKEIGASLDNFRQRFDASSKALQVMHGQDLSRQVAIVTGANEGGIGYEIARTLARSGCTVIFACRDLVKAESSIGQIRSERANVSCHAMKLNLASLTSVKSFAEQFLASYKRLDILILNAGIFSHPQAMTEDGLEITFQVNYLSHFYLCHCLRPALINASLPKIVAVSAEAHRFATLSNPDEFLAEQSLNKVNSPSTLIYNNTKLFCLMFALEVSNVWSDIRAIAVHPGNMVCSRLSRHWWLYRLAFAMVRPFAKSLQQAAAPAIFAAASPEMRHIGGIYINNCFPCSPSKIAEDPQARRNLWNTSVKMLQERGFSK